MIILNQSKVITDKKEVPDIFFLFYLNSAFLFKIKNH